jgi:hypothetical protein
MTAQQPAPAVKASVAEFSTIDWSKQPEVKEFKDNPRPWHALKELPFFPLDAPRLLRILMINQAPPSLRKIVKVWVDILIPLPRDDALLDDPTLVQPENNGKPEYDQETKAMLAVATAPQHPVLNVDQNIISDMGPVGTNWKIWKAAVATIVRFFVFLFPFYAEVIR